MKFLKRILLGLKLVSQLNTVILIYVSFFRTWFTNPLIYIYNLYNLYKFYDNIKASSRE